MLRRFSVDFAILMIVLDAILVSIALWLSSFLRPEVSYLLSFTKNFKGPYILSPWLYPIFSITWVLVLVLFSLYDGRKNFRLADELTSLTFGSILASVSIAGLLYLTFRDFSRALFTLFIAITFLSMVTIRLLYRLYFRAQAAKGVQTRRVLIIGAGKIGLKLAQNIQDFTHFGLQLAGFLDDDPKKRARRHILGTVDDARQVIIEHRVDDVVMALPLRAYHRSNQLAIELHNLPVRVWLVPDYFSLALNQAGVDNLAGMPMIDLRAPALNEYQRMTKRVFDLFASVVLFPVLLPVMGLISLAIRLDSPGPALFRQMRVGENGRLFKIYKFRTMVDNAEIMRQIVEKVDAQGRIIQDKSLKDPRITRVGKILRRTSLDEIPQILNVLKGEMSLVGPRPELPHLVDQYEPWQRARFAVPQGMTGWWQVNGRSDKPMNLNTEDDLYYVQNYSIWLDFKILFRTLWVVLLRKGAY